MTYSSEPRQLKDFDILGVGASRREQLLKVQEPFVLQTHPILIEESVQGVYQELLRETLRWLKPQSLQEIKIDEAREAFLFQRLWEDLQREFPRTMQILKSQSKEVLSSYLREFPWQGPLLSAQFRYLPVFLKKKFLDSPLYLIAQSEWLSSYLSFADFGFPPGEKGRLILNPSLQSLYIPAEVSELSLTSGLYVYYYDFNQAKVRKHKMDIYEAGLVDLLQEDRKFTRDQILDQAVLLDLGGSLSSSSWLKKLSYFIELGIIFESDGRWIADRNM